MLLGDLVRHAAERFESVGIDSALADAELLAGHILGLSRGGVQAQVLMGATVSESDAESIANLYGRRLAREPLQHITGLAYFRQLELVVGKGVFIPRPETEFVAQLAIDAIREAIKSGAENPIAVDLGTGSGAIALAMATENFSEAAQLPTDDRRRRQRARDRQDVPEIGDHPLVRNPVGAQVCGSRLGWRSTRHRA